MVRWACCTVLAGLLAAYSHASSAQQALGLSPGESASGLANVPNRRYRFVCAAIGEPTTNVWGTDDYADDSDICSAAIHAGVLRLNEARMVTIVIGPGASSFRGSVQNDVTSASYSNGDASYRFDTSADPGQISWTTTALRIPPGFAEPVYVICPAGGPTDGIVWGANPYHSDTSVCLAAVHAGVITPADGGPVAVTKTEGPQTFTAEPRNGVDSRAWSAGDDAFTVSAGIESGEKPQEGGVRRIRTNGFTGAGNTIRPQKRIITTDGFTGAGDTIPPRRRIITTDGWTGQGAGP